MIGGDSAKVAGRENIASQVVNFADKLATQMIDLNNRVYEKLGPISAPDVPLNKEKVDRVEEAWPSYFAQLREFFRTIESNIGNINRAIDRMEV